MLQRLLDSGRRATACAAPALLFLLVLPVLLVTLAAPRAAHADGWTLLPNGPRAGFSARHDDFSFINANEGWIVNGDGEVWHTPDGGNSWAPKTFTGVYNRCVAFFDSNHGFIGTLYQTNGQALLETFNGGTTWQTVNLPAPVPRGLCGMEIIDATTITAVGTYYGYPEYIRSEDAGATWTTYDMSAYIGALVDIHWFGPRNGVAVGSTAPGPNRRTVVLRTNDGGATWSVRWTGTRDKEICWKISFVNNLVGFVSIENLNSTGATYFLKTVDGGWSWNEYQMDPNFLNCQGIGFLTEYYGWIGGWNIGTYITRNGGTNWTWKNFGYNVNRIRFLSPSLGYAVGRDVYKYTADPADAGTPPPPPEPRLLGLNRPNPFADRTVIPYTVATAGEVSLRVFDPQGRPVRELYAGARDSGVYQATFDAQGLPAGAYYVELRTPDGVETRKLQVVR